MYCSYCGTKNEDSAATCVSCGAPLGAPATPAEPVAPAPATPADPQQAPQVPPQMPPYQQMPPNQMPPYQPMPPYQQMPPYQPMPPYNMQQPQPNAASKPMVEVMVIGMIASGIYALGAFLPYARVLFASISLIDGGIMSDAGIVLLFGLLGIGAAATPKRSVTIMIIGILQLGLVLLKSSVTSTVNYSYGAGYYCLWIGGFLTLITGIYGMIKHSKM